MKFLQISKRVLLFLGVNALIMVTISMVLHFTGLNRGMSGGRYQSLMIFCLLWGMGGAFISLAMSRLMAKWFMGVKLIDPATNEAGLRDVVGMVHTLARKANLPELPQVGYFESNDVNAFATGPTKSRSLVAVSTGLLRSMNRREVEGVLAHEVAHIANGDMVTMTLVQGVINAFVMFFARILASVVSSALRSRDDRGGGGMIHWLLIMAFEFVFSLLGAVVVCWFSRWREFRADAGGAALSSRANMADALRALQRVHQPQLVSAQGGQSAAFQSMMISGKSKGLMQLLSTHPPLDERIARLEAGL